MRKQILFFICFFLATSAQAETSTIVCDEVYKTSSISSESENINTPKTTILVEVIDGKTHCTIQEVYE